MKILFSSFTCQDIGVAMVTNMISQLQELQEFQKVVFYVGISSVFYYMAAWGYEFYLRVLKVSLTSERSQRVRDTFSTRR